MDGWIGRQMILTQLKQLINKWTNLISIARNESTEDGTRKKFRGVQSSVLNV